MATTSNYGWTIPDDTDLVKNGALAIRTLGNAIDTTAAASFGGGLVHINTTTFSAVASQSINDVFNSTYDNYKIIFEGNASNTSTGFAFRFRASGTDNSSSLYQRQRNLSDNASLTSLRVTNDSGFALGDLISTDRDYIQIELFNPNKAQVTGARICQARRYATTLVNWLEFVGGHNSSSVFDGFTLYVGGAGITFSGTLSIYGYRKS